MQNNSYHVPFYVLTATGGVATSGHCSDLTAAKIGIFDRETFSVATSGGTAKEVFFAQGVLGGKDWFGNTITASSHKSPFFRFTDVEDIYVSLPQAPQNEEWILGYNGAAGSVGLTYTKGKATRVRIILSGEPIYRFFGGFKEYIVSHTPQVDCTQPCDTGDCEDNAISDPIVELKKHIDKFNNHVELKKFGVKVFATFAAAPDEGTGGTVTATRTLKIMLNRNADGTDRTAEFTDWIGAIPGIVLDGDDEVVVTKTAGAGTTTEGQADEYTVTQTSYEVPDAEYALSSNVTFNYHEVPTIEGMPWTVLSETDPATTAAGTPVTNRKVGMRFVMTGFRDPQFSNASFSPLDYYNEKPIKFEVAVLQEDGDRCDASKYPTQLQTKTAKIGRQTGEWVIREVLMKTDAYLKHMDQFHLDSRMREAFDMKLIDQVDRNAYYKLYYIRFKASYGYGFRTGEQEKFTAVFAVKTTDTTLDTNFNTNVIDVVEAKTSITIHTNS